MQEYLTSDELRNILGFLNESLPDPPTQHNGPFLLSQAAHSTLGSYQFQQNQLQGLANNFMRHLGLPPPSPVLLRDGETSPGLNIAIEHERPVILITKNSRYRLRHHAAVLAHECIHSYLGHHRVKDSDTHNNEILTDVAAAFLGLGHFLVDAYRPVEWSTVSNSIRHDHSITLGYVASESLRKAIIITSKIRNWNLLETRSSFRRIDDKTIFYLFTNPLVARLTNRSNRGTG